MLLTRGTVKADNSCLFAATARLCEGITNDIHLKAASRRLRSVCANAALSDPDPSTRAILLGHDSVEQYAEWIRNEHHWGGEPEVLMLSAHYAVEIVVVSCESLNFLRYAHEGTECKSCIYLLYTGQHYDPLLGADGSLCFPLSNSSDVRSALEASALEIARQHNTVVAARALERRVNRLKCSGCGAIIDDAAAFQDHCNNVEHADDFTCASILCSIAHHSTLEFLSYAGCVRLYALRMP